MENLKAFIKDNAIQFIGFVFAVSGVYHEFKSSQKELELVKLELVNNEQLLKSELKVIEERLDKKIKLIKELRAEVYKIERSLDDRIDELESCK